MGSSVILRLALLTLCVTLTLSQVRIQARTWVFQGRIQLDKACRTAGTNNVTLTEKTCPGCGTCSIGPIRTRVNNTVIKAFFCRYRNPFLNIEQRACLIQNDITNALIKSRNCGLQQRCTLGPIHMNLRNNTSGRLYLCQGNRPDAQRRPIVARQRRQPNVNLFQIMVNESCRMINMSANSMTVRSCCLNCSNDPIIITMDSHRLQLFYCLDDTSNFTRRIAGRKPPRPIFPGWGRGGGRQGRMMGGIWSWVGRMVGGRGGRQGGRQGGVIGGYGGQGRGQARAGVRVGMGRQGGMVGGYVRQVGGQPRVAVRVGVGRQGGMMGGYRGQGGMMGGYGGSGGGQPRPPVRVGPVRPRPGRGQVF